MIIKRSDLASISNHEEYIKSRCSDVSNVYSCSIYFFGGAMTFFAWDYPGGLSRYYQDFILSAINGICKTEFKFEEGE